MGPSWLLGWRDIARSDMRTVIVAAFFPGGRRKQAPCCLPDQRRRFALVSVGTLASLVVRLLRRQKVGGTPLTSFYINQFPMLAHKRTPSVGTIQRRSGKAGSRHACLELTYTSHDMTGFAMDAGYSGPPFRWDPERRAILRAELDAAFFHLYGLDADDTAYILDTFPVLRDKEVRQFGEYRTRRLVLERYAALATAIATRTPYLPPLPAPRLPPRRPPGTSPSPKVSLTKGAWGTSGMEPGRYSSARRMTVEAWSQHWLKT
jgi:hypothetical protein